MSKTPEQMAQEYSDQDKVACDAINHAAEHLIKDAFLAGYKAAKDAFADTSKVTPKQSGNLLHKVANDYLDIKAARYRRVCGYKK